MEPVTRVALATDAEVEHALNVLVKGFTISHPDLAPTIADSREARAMHPNEILDAEKVASGDRAKAYRAILVELAQSPVTAASVAPALAARKTLIEPVTTALVLAGIVMLLSTDIKVEHSDIDGKKKTTVKITKPATSEAILKKFFDLFGTT